MKCERIYYHFMPSCHKGQNVILTRLRRIKLDTPKLKDLLLNIFSRCQIYFDLK